jgi:predicted SnoaL-like aldol condensation-catalyzing enzyme
MSQIRQEKNKTLVLDAFDTLFNKRVYAAAEKYWSPDYIQHSAHIEPGRDGLFNLIRSAPDTLRYEHQLIVAEGELCYCPRTLHRIRPASCLDRRGYCQDRERPPRRALGCSAG